MTVTSHSPPQCGGVLQVTEKSPDPASETRTSVASALPKSTRVTPVTLNPVPWIVATVLPAPLP